MMDLQDNQLVIRRPGRTIPIATVDRAARIAAIVTTGHEPAAAPLIADGMPRMLAKAIALIGWQGAWKSAALDAQEYQIAAAWHLRQKYQPLD